MKQKATRQKYQEKFAGLQEQCQAEVQNKLKDYVQEIERLQGMQESHEQEMVSAHDENIRAIDILQRSLKHVSNQYSRLSQLFPHSHLLPTKPQVVTNSASLSLFTTLSSRDKHPCLEVKDNKLYLYKQADSNNHQSLKRNMQNKVRYRFDRVVQGMQELVGSQESSVLQGEHIQVIYGHKNSCKHRVMEQFIFVLLNKIRLMVNTEKLVDSSRSFLVKVKLQTFQQEQIDTLHEQKIDTDYTLMDQELVT